MGMTDRIMRSESIQTMATRPLERRSNRPELQGRVSWEAWRGATWTTMATWTWRSTEMTAPPIGLEFTRTMEMGPLERRLNRLALWALETAAWPGVISI